MCGLGDSAQSDAQPQVSIVCLRGSPTSVRSPLYWTTHPPSIKSSSPSDASPEISLSATWAIGTAVVALMAAAPPFKTAAGTIVPSTAYVLRKPSVGACGH